MAEELETQGEVTAHTDSVPRTLLTVIHDNGLDDRIAALLAELDVGLSVYPVPC